MAQEIGGKDFVMISGKTCVMASARELVVVTAVLHRVDTRELSLVRLGEIHAT